MTGTAVDLIWLAPALALLGFVLNGTLALARPAMKTAVSIIGVGVLVGCFAIGIAVFRSFVALHTDAPVVLQYWSWIPVGSLQVNAGFQAAQLSTVMLLGVTSAGALSHIFGVGY